LARPEGIEPPAYRFEACRSIQLSYGRTEDLEKGVDEFRRKNTMRRSTRAMLESLFALAVSCGVGAASLLHHHTRAGSSIGRAADS
jgi:hypothetical protein